MNYRYCLGQDGLALQRNVDTLLLAVKQADGCEPRHVRCDRKRKRSFSGLSAGVKIFCQNTPNSSMDSRNTHLKGTRWKNLSRNVHGEVVLRQYSEHNAEQQEQEQYKEPHEEPMLTSLL